MRVLLIFVLINVAVSSEEEESERIASFVNRIVSGKICCDYGIEEMHDECRKCAEQAGTSIQTNISSEDILNIMSETNIPKTKEIVTKCSNYFVNSEQFVECTKIDEEGFISCMKTVFPARQKKRMASYLCIYSESDGCEQCIFDSFKEVWQRHYNKTAERDLSDSKGEDERYELMENEATEMTNNCNHFFENKNIVKKCATKEFGNRMKCAVQSMYFYSAFKNPAYDLCHYATEDDTMEENCLTCVSQITHSDDFEYHDDDQLQEKEYYTKAIEKCGQYIQQKEEMVECTRMEADPAISCIEDVYTMISVTRSAKTLCNETEKSDECVECTVKSLLSAWEAYLNSTSAEFEDDDYSGLIELEVKEIKRNCYQYFQKESVIRRAKTLCNETEKSDECVECTVKCLLNAWEAYVNSTSAKFEDDDYSGLIELEAKEIASNCYQYFQKKEE